jgi:hypothetical protein
VPDARGADAKEVLQLRHPLALMIVAGALAAMAAVFSFIRPQYQAPDYGGRTIDLSGFPPPAHGWTWKDGQPGYRFGVREEDWNMSNLQPSELVPLQRAAQRLGLRDVRPLTAQRYAPHRLGIMVAATNRADQTCLGFALPERAISFACPRDAAAFVAVVPNSTGAFIFGIARADGRSVTVQQAGMPPQATFGGHGNWGVFSVTLGGRQAQLNVGGRRVQLQLDASSPQLLRVAG